MASRRICHSWGVALLLTFATAALTEAPPEEAVSREESTTEASLLTCDPARCGADWMCEDMCPSAQTAVCVNFYCQYTYPSGGGELRRVGAVTRPSSLPPAAGAL